MNDMATCTILVVACLSWPCFFDSNKICSFSKPQSPESLEIVMIATSNLEVDARSDAYNESLSIRITGDNSIEYDLTCRVCFSSTDSFSSAAWTLLCSMIG